MIIICSVHTITIQLEHHSQYVTWCVCITDYWVWYRDDSQAEIDEIPDLEIEDYRLLTLDEIVSATRGHRVTHMSISGDIPPIDRIAPHLKQLQLRDPPDIDQSDRSVNGPPLTLIIWVCLVHDFWMCQEYSYHSGFYFQMRSFINGLILSHSANNVL